jgi:hypothetical protein
MAMSTTIKLSDELIAEARRYGDVYSRSAPKQIEYWSRIGKIAEENPDMPYNFIKDILIAKQEKPVPFKFNKN